MKKRPFFFITVALFAMPIVAVTVLGFTNSFAEKQLPNYGAMPAFQLVERSGRQVSSDELARKVLIVSFLFTHCAEQCPRIAAKMQTLMKALRFKENLRLLSITVDPERDTAPVLAEYAKQWEADPYKWLFFTGRKKEIDFLVQQGFRLAAAADGNDVLHSDKLVLVDGYGRIRGYYDANEDYAVKTLLKDAKKLLRQTTF